MKPTNETGGSRVSPWHFALICLPYLYLVQRFWFVTDDAFISFRFAKNLALGHGLRFNPGEHLPVEGYSNFLWVVLTAFLEKIGANIVLLIPLLSTLCGLVLLYRVLAVLQGPLRVRPAVALLCGLSLGCFPPFAVWSSSGLETMPFALLVFLNFEHLVIRKPFAPGRSALLALLLVLIRVEGIGWVLILGLLGAGVRGFSHKVRWRPVWLFLGLLSLGCLIYFGWRYTYYGQVLSNTVSAKSGLPFAYYKRGFFYVASHFLTFVTPFLLLITPFFALRRSRLRLGLPLSLLAWGFPLYGLVVTGDFMCMGRFLVPGFAFNTLLLAWLLEDLWGSRGRLALGLGAVLIGVGLLPGFDQHLVPQEIREKFHFRFNTQKKQSEYQQWKFQRRNGLRWSAMGRTLKQYGESHFEGTPSLVTDIIGAVGYWSDYFMYDRCGLITREVTEREFDPNRKMLSPGHDKYVSAYYFLKHKPQIFYFHYIEGETLKEISAQIRASAEQLRQSRAPQPLATDHLLDFVEIDSYQTEVRYTYLVVWRRLEPGQDPEAAWTAYANKVKKLAKEPQ